MHQSAPRVPQQNELHRDLIVYESTYPIQYAFIAVRNGRLLRRATRGPPWWRNALPHEQHFRRWLLWDHGVLLRNSGLQELCVLVCNLDTQYDVVVLTQAHPGAALVVNESSPYSRGMIDWGYAAPANNGLTGVAALQPSGGGAYKMARTLSPSSPNQVRNLSHFNMRLSVVWLGLSKC